MDAYELACAGNLTATPRNHRTISNPEMKRAALRLVRNARMVGAGYRPTEGPNAPTLRTEMFSLPPRSSSLSAFAFRFRQFRNGRASTAHSLPAQRLKPRTSILAQHACVRARIGARSAAQSADGWVHQEGVNH